MREKHLTLYAIIILVILIYQPGGLVALLGQATPAYEEDALQEPSKLG